MSTQPQQQQPVDIYPNTVTGQLPPVSHSHSNGSFGTVFIVLAVIIVVSAMACCLSRLCNKSQGNNKHHNNNNNNKPNKQSHQNPNFSSEERGERGRDQTGGDLEFGSDKGSPKSGAPGNGGEGSGYNNKPSSEHALTNNNTNGHGHGQGEIKHVSDPVDDGQLKPGS